MTQRVRRIHRNTKLRFGLLGRCVSSENLVLIVLLIINSLGEKVTGRHGLRIANWVRVGLFCSYLSDKSLSSAGSCKVAARGRERVGLKSEPQITLITPISPILKSNPISPATRRGKHLTATVTTRLPGFATKYPSVVRWNRQDQTGGFQQRFHYLPATFLATFLASFLFSFPKGFPFPLFM